MNTIKLLTLTMGLTVGLIFVEPANAIDLQTAKQQGKVCEGPDGFIQARDGSPDVQALVSQVNSKRHAEYQRIAAQNGTTPDAAAAVAAQKLRAAGHSCH